MNVELIYTKNTSHLAARVSRECMMPLYEDNVRVFSNREMSVSVAKNFRNAVLLASVVNNDDWFELFLLLDALRTAGNILLCMPYCGYARQDHHVENESCGAELTLRFLENFSNVRRCIFLDRHREPSINIPMMHLHAGMIFADDIRSRYNNIAIVSPDFGGTERAADVANFLSAPLVICNKFKSLLGTVKKIDVIGDVKGKNCVLVDDMADSGETLCVAANELMLQGAAGVSAYVTHGLLSGRTVENIEKSPLNEVVFTDSLLYPCDLPEKFRVVSIASLIISAIRGMLPSFF